MIKWDNVMYFTILCNVCLFLQLYIYIGINTRADIHTSAYRECCVELLMRSCVQKCWLVLVSRRRTRDLVWGGRAHQALETRKTGFCPWEGWVAWATVHVALTLTLQQASPLPNVTVSNEENLHLHRSKHVRVQIWFIVWGTERLLGNLLTCWESTMPFKLEWNDFRPCIRKEWRQINEKVAPRVNMVVCCLSKQVQPPCVGTQHLGSLHLIGHFLCILWLATWNWHCCKVSQSALLHTHPKYSMLWSTQVPVLAPASRSPPLPAQIIRTSCCHSLMPHIA